MRIFNLHAFICPNKLTIQLLADFLKRVAKLTNFLMNNIILCRMTSQQYENKEDID